MSQTIHNYSRASLLAATVLGVPKFRYYDVQVEEGRKYADATGTTCHKLGVHPDSIVIYTPKNGYTSVRKSTTVEEAKEILAAFDRTLPIPPTNWLKSTCFN